MCASDSVSEQSSSIWDKVARFKKVLITHEDPYHNHKILGLLTLASFIFRFSNVGDDDMAFERYPALTIPTVLVHLLTNLSSFIFRIPKKRISHGGRIWPEYRWHSLIFTARSHLLILWYMYERHYNLEPNYEVNFLIVMAAIFFADLASWGVGEQYRSPSVRGVDTSPAVKFFFSAAQFNGTAGLLFGLRRMTIAFLPIFVMQITAFMGTLQRKNLIRYVGLVGYAALILNSFAVQWYEYNRVGGNINYAVRIIGFGAALLRLSPLPKVFSPIQNKYVIWTAAYLVLRAVRPHLDEIPAVYMKVTLAGMIAALVVAYYFKRDYYKTPIAPAGKKVD